MNNQQQQQQQPPPLGGIRPQQMAPGLQAIPQLAATGVPGAFPNNPAQLNPGLVAPGAMLTALTPQQQLIMQQHIQFNRIIAAGQLTPQLLAQNPQLAAYYQLLRQQAAMQQQLKVQAAGGRPPVPQQQIVAARAPSVGAPLGPTLAAAPAAPPAKPRPASSAGTGSAQQQQRKRKGDRLPDKAYNLLPESPLFVELQSAERRIDAAIAKKRAALLELSAGLTRANPGEEVKPGAARKRLRVYIFSNHYNQPNAISTDGQAKPSSVGEPPSWALTIHGRVVDPTDASHPGGGGDPQPNTTTPKAPFSSFVKHIRIELDKEQYPGESGVLDWHKPKHDREHRSSFQVRRPGAAPVTARITIELDHTPQLWRVPPAVEKLLGLPTGPEGGGLYSMGYLTSAVWNYARSHDLVEHGTIERLLLDEDLRAALKLPTVGALEFHMLQGALKDLVANAGSAEPVSIEYTIPVSGPSPSKPMCLDFHIEVPLSTESSPGVPDYVHSLRVKSDAALRELDHSLVAMVGRYTEHKRRHTVLAAFSVDPAATVQELVSAQGKELRMAASRESEAAEVMRSTELYGEKWTQDAVLKYLAKKAAVAAANTPAAVAANNAMQQRIMQHQATMMMMAAAQQQAMQQAVVAQQMQQQAANANVNVAGQQQQQQQQVQQVQVEEIMPQVEQKPVEGGANPAPPAQ